MEHLDAILSGPVKAFGHEVHPDDPEEDETLLARIRLDGEHWWAEGPPLSELLRVIDEAHERQRAGSLSETC